MAAPSETDSSSTMRKSGGEDRYGPASISCYDLNKPRFYQYSSQGITEQVPMIVAEQPFQTTTPNSDLCLSISLSKLLGRMISILPGDGNCFYRVVAKFLWDNVELYMKARILLAKELEENETEWIGNTGVYSESITFELSNNLAEVSFADYVKAVKTEGKYGDTGLLKVLEKLYPDFRYVHWTDFRNTSNLVNPWHCSSGEFDYFSKSTLHLIGGGLRQHIDMMDGPLRRDDFHVIDDSLPVFLEVVKGLSPLKFNALTFTRVPVLGDGNCLLHCIGWYLYKGDTRAGATVRSQLVEYSKTEQGISFLRSQEGRRNNKNSEDNLKKTLDKFKNWGDKPMSWVSYDMLALACHFFDVNILTYLPREEYSKAQLTRIGAADLPSQNGDIDLTTADLLPAVHAEFHSVCEADPTDSKRRMKFANESNTATCLTKWSEFVASRKVIHVMYINSNHYDVMVFEQRPTTKHGKSLFINNNRNF